MRRYHRNDKGFTMAEMLITVAIIVILCGFAFVAVIAHQRNLKRMEMDETAQEIFIAAQNHLTAAEANGQWDAFLKKTSGAASEAEAARGTWLQNGPTGYDKSTDKDASSRKFYSFTTESVEAVQKGAVSLILPEGSIDETLRGHHFYVEYDAVSGTVYGVFYTDADHAITAEDAANVSRTDANARRDYKDENGKRTIIGYYGGALGELKNSGDLYAPSVAVRNAESLVLYVVDKNYHRHVSAQGGAGTFQTQLKLTFEGETSKAAVEKTVDPAKVGSGTDSFSRSVLACDSAKEFSVIVPGRSADEGGVQKTESVKAKYYAIVLDSIVREDGHFADLFAGAASGENGGSAQFIPGEDIKITVTLHSNNGGEDVSQTVTVNSLFNSVKQEKNALGVETGKAIVTVSNPRHLENLSTEVSGVDFTQIKSGTTIDTVSVVRNLFWDEDAAAGKVAKDQNENEAVTAFLPAIASATGMTSPFGYCADGSTSIAKDEIQVYPYQAGTGVGNTGENADKNSGSSNGDDAKAGGSENAAAEIAKGACYGITNTAIKTFEGNNHMLAAFRFEGEQKAALINEAADGLKMSDLVIADATAAVTGQASSGNGTDPEQTPTAATLIADAKSGSLENIAVRWYEGSATSGTTNESVSLPAGKNLKTADGLEGCRVFSSKGIASALIGSIDAGAENADGKFTIKHTTVATVAASSSGKKTAPLGVEGETAAALVGQVKSGEVVLDNSGETDENKKSTAKVEGTLGLTADCGTKDNQTAGGLIGSIGQGKVQVKQFVLAADSVEINGAAAAGGVIGEVKSEKEQAVSLEDVNLVARSLKATSSEKYAGGLIGDSSGTGSVTVKNAALSLNTLEVNGKHAAGGAAGQISAGSSSFDGFHILTTKAAGDSGETGQAATGDEDTYGIRVTAENGMAGGLIGAVTANVSKVEIQNTAVSGSGTADQVESGSSAGGLIGDTKAGVTIIRSSMASLYIKSQGNGGNSGGSSSTDGAGGLIGSASGNVTATNSYSGGRTTNADNPEKKAGDAAAMQARYIDSAEGQGRYNVQLVAGSGAAGGLIGKYTGSGLTLANSYSTSSVAVNKASGARAGGLIGEAEGSLTANNTYCTGRVYVSLGAGESSSSTKEESTPNYGAYAGKLASISGQSNYYLKGMKGAPAGSVGTLGSNSQNPSVDEKTLTGADYYDNNCPLKQGVDPAQKSYYFDSTITERYAFKTVTTTYAKTLYDPNTGEKVENADADSSKYAQIGDWENPAEESTEGTYGLIYYEKIYDPTTGKNEPTFYYHGFIRTSGNSAEDAVYTEIQQTKLPANHDYTANGFVTDKETYVSEDGYLLLVGKDADANKLTIAFGQSNQEINSLNQNGIRLSDIVSEEYPIQSENVPELAGYKAYVVNQKGNDWTQNQFFRAWGGSNDQYGGAIVIWETTQIIHEYYTEEKQYGRAGAAFTYLPFFADTVRKADGGHLQNVGIRQEDNKVVFGIRSARQLRSFIEAENANDGWQNYLGSAQNCIVEQQLDITINHKKVHFTDKTATKDEDSVYYTIPTLSQVRAGMFRSHLRPDPEDNQDFYVLDGLRGSFVTNVIGGEICKLKLNDMKAPYFAFAVENISTIENVTIQNSLFASGKVYDQATTAAFVNQSSYGNNVSVKNCTIKDSQIHGNGFAGTVSVGTWENCIVENCKIDGNGFAGKLDSNVTKVSSCMVKNSSITKNGFAEEVHTEKGSIEKCGVYHSRIEKNGFAEKIDHANGISDCELVDNRIGENGFAESLVTTPNIQNCKILNAIIGGNGFATTSNANINGCKIINARIGKNGFLEKNGGVINTTAVYADKNEYSKEKTNPYYTEYFTPYRDDEGGYQYLVIGVAPDGTIGNANTAGFVLGDTGWHSVISDCFVTGTIYGQDVAGFIGNVGDSNNSSVKTSYANVIIHATGKATGFAFTAGTQTEISGCHILGIIDAKGDACGLLEKAGNQAKITGNYSALWSVTATGWYPFYKSISTTDGNKTQCSQNFYLSDCKINVSNSNLIDYGQNAKGLSYARLCNQTIEGLQKGTQANTKGYYQYMNDDNDHKIYPYPMPSGMTAYGDWSHADPDSYTLLYYEKVDGQYYFHGYTTKDGETYKELKTSGENVENGLLAAAGKAVEDDGYLLIAGTNSSWSSFGRADNSGAVSSPVNNANTQILTQISSDSELAKALGNLQGLRKKDTDRIYTFQPDQYLSYEDTTKNFASWQTLTQESGGVGIAIYSTKGLTPMAKFSFQPFFADTVEAPSVASQGTSNPSEITFVSTKDGDQEHDYRIRSLRQLQALSDWDAGIWNKKTVADSNNLRSNFDKDNTKRCSYLSTSNENYAGGLKVRQDLDIDVKGSNINFDRLDGTYAGRTYSDRSVMLQNLKYDFADVVAPGGEVGSLVIDQANLQGQATTAAQNGDIAHGGRREFVEYNYGTIQNITVQNSKLGSAGLVYQNGDVPENVVSIASTVTDDNPRQYIWMQEVGDNACQYVKKITYTASDKILSGTIEQCVIQQSVIQGAGIVWKNIGGNIKETKVQQCSSIGNAGAVAYNQATHVEAPTQIMEYQYKYQNKHQSVPEELLKKYHLPIKEESSTKISVAVDAIIENCQVIDCTVKGNGFVGENSVNTAGSVGTSAAGSSGVRAKISNCQVYGTSNYSDMKIGGSSGTSGVNEAAGFIGSNGKGAEITDCSVTGQVNGLKDVAGFALTNAGTITGSYANTKVTCGGQQGTTISGFVGTNTGTIDRSHSLGEESYQKSGAGDGNRAAGFVVCNQKAEGSDDSAVIKNSYAAVWKLTNLDGINYVPFGSIGSDADAGSYENCYAMRLSENDGYQGTYSAADAPKGITYVSGEELQGKCESDLGSAAEDGKTTAYQAELKNEKYPFPCGSVITNYGDWKLTDGAMTAARTITLDAGGKAVFFEDLVRSLSTEASVMSVSAEDMDAVSGDSNSSDVAGEASIPEEERHKVQVELGEEEETLDLSEFAPIRKGWKLLGWIITSPSELSSSEKMTTVSNIVTKINKISDAAADTETEESNADSVSDNSEKEQIAGTDSSENAAEGSGETKEDKAGSAAFPRAGYELETGTKSYHYAPDAVITVTEDMTLAAVWVPDDDTIAKAKDGTLRMDENGNILEDDADSADTAGTGSSDQADAALTEDAAQTAGTAKTDDTAQTTGTGKTGDAAGTEDSAADGTTETDPADQGNTNSSDAGQTQDGTGNGQTADDAGSDPAESRGNGQEASSQDAGSSEASTEAATYSTEDAEPVKDPGV